MMIILYQADAEPDTDVEPKDAEPDVDVKTKHSEPKVEVEPDIDIESKDIEPDVDTESDTVQMSKSKKCRTRTRCQRSRCPISDLKVGK